MNSWPILSRMPSNLCYREAHPSRCALRDRKTQLVSCRTHTCKNMGVGSDHSQRGYWTAHGKNDISLQEKQQKRKISHKEQTFFSSKQLVTTWLKQLLLISRQNFMFEISKRVTRISEARSVLGLLSHAQIRVRLMGGGGVEGQRSRKSIRD